MMRGGEYRLENWEGLCERPRIFQAVGMACANALKWESAWYVREWKESLKT